MSLISRLFGEPLRSLEAPRYRVDPEYLPVTRSRYYLKVPVRRLALTLPYVMMNAVTQIATIAADMPGLDAGWTLGGTLGLAFCLAPYRVWSTVVDREENGIKMLRNIETRRNALLAEFPDLADALTSLSEPWSTREERGLPAAPLKTSFPPRPALPSYSGGNKHSKAISKYNGKPWYAYEAERLREEKRSRIYEAEEQARMMKMVLARPLGAATFMPEQATFPEPKYSCSQGHPLTAVERIRIIHGKVVTQLCGCPADKVVEGPCYSCKGTGFSVGAGYMTTECPSCRP